jgi:predicted nucleotide-binding protein
MELERTYRATRFAGEVLVKAIRVFEDVVDADAKGETDSRTIARGTDLWRLDTDEEFLAEYAQGCQYAHFQHTFRVDDVMKRRVITFNVHSRDTEVHVRAPERSHILRVMNVFDANAAESRLPPPPEPAVEPEPPPTVFIGHGRSGQWRDLKDHLQDKHGYDVEAYEVGARAGHTIRDILESMLSSSSCAVLVMTAEDEQASGDFHPRQNVVHELGLFQGRLGFNRAIMLLEAGAQPFSNMQGIDQVRYAKGNIRETFGEVLAVLRREFGPAD